MSEKKSFVLRMDQTAYKALEKWAADEFRSVNGQIEFILNQALKDQFGKAYPDRFRKSAVGPPSQKNQSDQAGQ